VSNYEKDSEICLHQAQDQVPNASLKTDFQGSDPFLDGFFDGPHEILTLREYGEMRGCYPRIKYGLQLPDLYVRALNGASKATTADVAAMDDASLERAKEVLAAFDEVLVLERPDFSARLAELTRMPQASAPHKSNNKYSDARTATSTADVAQHLPANIAAARADHAHESDWLNKISRLDAELYYWASGEAAAPSTKARPDEPPCPIEPPLEWPLPYWNASGKSPHSSCRQGSHLLAEVQAAEVAGARWPRAKGRVGALPARRRGYDGQCSLRQSPRCLRSSSSLRTRARATV